MLSSSSREEHGERVSLSGAVGGIKENQELRVKSDSQRALRAVYMSRNYRWSKHRGRGEEESGDRLSRGGSRAEQGEDCAEAVPQPI